MSHRKNEWETVSMGNEDEWNEPISGETDSEPIDGYYKTLESERGEAKGSFFVPEDSKTVVTASGKVIETDTEAIQKKLEQKREERKALPVEGTDGSRSRSSARKRKKRRSRKNTYSRH